MSGRPYLTPSSITQLRATLREGDWSILADVHAMRLAAANDLQTLEALRGPLHVRQFRRQLQWLHEHGVLCRLERSVGGARAGSAGYVYGVGLAGQRLLAGDWSEPVRRPWTPRPSWLHHALTTSHLYVVLRTAEADKALRLLDYQPEPKAWRSFTGPQGVVVLKPDAFVRFETAEDVVSYFVEVDCGTESPTTIARKAEVYRQYWLTGEEQRTHSVFPAVLWLAPDAARCRALTTVLARQPDGADRLHRVARHEEAPGVFREQPP